MPPDERRQFVRLDTTLPVSYRVLPARPSEPQQPAQTKNVSEGGLCVFLKERLPAGTRLEVQVTLPGREKPAAFTAEVTWCEEFEVVGKTQREQVIQAGAKFISIDPKDHEAIMQHAILSLRVPGPRPSPSSQAGSSS